MPENTPTDVTVTTDDTGHSSTTVKGDVVTYDATTDHKTDTHGTWSMENDNHVRGLIAEAEGKRQAIEDHRANKRNLNRLLTLLCAAIIGFIVVTFFENDGFAFLGWSHVLSKTMDAKLYGYSFIITIVLDSSLAAWSLIRRY